MNNINFDEFKSKSNVQLIDFCKQNKIECLSYNKTFILTSILKYLSKDNNVTFIGYLEIINNNYGFLRDIKMNFIPTTYDLYVNIKFIKDFDLRPGHEITCTVAPLKGEDQKCLSVKEILLINGESTDKKYELFEELTPIYPNKQIVFENGSSNKQYNNINRYIDLISPIGWGQRALIVAQPKTGKTTILHSLGIAILHNYPKAKLIILLIGERPEEVTHMKSICPNADIIYSTFDEIPENQIKTSEMAIDIAKRRTERGEDVIILQDSATRLIRAYNQTVPSSGKVLSGGVESLSLQKSKQLFGAARNLKEGGSLTIISTCLIETGSKMDDCIFEELKGTGNSEIFLESKIAQKRIFPSINILKSGTRKAEDMITAERISKMNALINILSSRDISEATKFILDKIETTTNNQLFFATMQR